MKIRTVTLFSLLFLLLYQPNVLSNDLTTENKDLKEWKFFVDKGNRGEQLKIEDFIRLMEKLEKNLIDVKKAFSEMSIWGADFSYEGGKGWEIELDMARNTTENALKFLTPVKTKPNSIGLCVIFYYYIVNINNKGLEFERVEHFQKTIKQSGFNLRLWTIAFEKAHLLPLAVAKEKGGDLYEIKK